MAATLRTRLPAAERRSQLLDVAKAIVDRHGFHAVTMEGIARAAGVTRPVVYGHFPDLERLLEAMVARESARALDQLRPVLPEPGGGDLPALLKSTLRGYLEVVRSDPATWRLVLIPPEGAPEVLRERIAGGRAAVLAALTAVIGTGGGDTAIPDPELAARLLSGIADEMARLVLTEPERYPVERLVSLAGWFLERLRL